MQGAVTSGWLDCPKKAAFGGDFQVMGVVMIGRVQGRTFQAKEIS
jgi:hypothetical protein